MSDHLADERRDTLDAIDRRRDECTAAIPERAVLDGSSGRALRRAAALLRSAAWSDKTTSAEEAAEDFDDPGWAPNATLRIAALVDHLSELASPTANDIPSAAPPRSPAAGAPPPVSGGWTRITISELEERLEGMAPAVAEVALFDSAEGVQIARATSWQGEVVEIVDLATVQDRMGAQREILRAVQAKEEKAKTKEDKTKANAAKNALARLEARPQAWAEVCVRAGFARAHFGPDLTAVFFRKYVNARERLDVTVDVNAIVYGLVHHIARLAPHVDFARSAITDLEIQRLADHDKPMWRKACRALEGFPVLGPAWRSLGAPDTTALLTARGEQNGSKAPGADALLAHNFEEALLRAHGVRLVLLTADNGLARTIASRLPQGSVWLGYVDPLDLHERFVSPLLSWPRGTISLSKYSSLVEFIDEMLVCGLLESVVASDGTSVLEFRAHLDGEHQYVRDWQERRLFVRGLESPRGRPNGAMARWPLRELVVPSEPRASSARVTVDQVSVALEWVRSSVDERLDRTRLPLNGDSQREAWNFLKAVGLVDGDGRAIGRARLAAIGAQHDVDALRALVLLFDPVSRIVRAVIGGAHSVTTAKHQSDLGDRTFGAALGLAVASGLVWREGETLGRGDGFVTMEGFRTWLLRACIDPIRISDLAVAACREVNLSPPRFRDALAAVLADPRLSGVRGGSTEPRALDTKVLDVDDAGRIAVQELNADDILGLRSLTVRQ